MFPVLIEATRVRLRELEPADDHRVAEWFCDARTTRWLPIGPLNRDGALAYSRELRSAGEDTPRVGYHLLVETRPATSASVGAPQPIGVVSLGIDSIEHRRGELGFAGAPDRTSRAGELTEAAGAVLAFGFGELGLARIWAVTDPANEPAQRLLERLAMVFEGRLRSDLSVRGRRRDSLLYAMVADPEPGLYL